MKRERVLVAMSGGVDSSVAAAILRERGYDVVGVAMRLAPDAAGGGPRRRGTCCSHDDFEDARRVAERMRLSVLRDRSARRLRRARDRQLRRRVSGRPDAQSVRDVQSRDQVRPAVGSRPRARGRAGRDRPLRAYRTRPRRPLLPAARRRRQQGSVLLSVYAWPGRAGAHAFSAREHDQDRGPRAGPRARSHQRRQAREPGDLLRARSRLRADGRMRWPIAAA